MSVKKQGFLTSKEGAARLSIVAISLLIVMKLITSFITGSIGIRADAIHSTIDLFGAVIGLIGIRISARPPDEEHAFGHGKAENIAGVLIATLIFMAAGVIIYEAIGRLASGEPLEMVALGIYVTVAAIAINLLVSWHVFRVAKANHSPALEATARDLMADVFSSAAVLVGLILVGITGQSILDSIVALLVAALIARAAYITMRRSFGELMDSRLPQEEEEAIKSCIMSHEQVANLHALRTRRSGNQRYIDLHLQVSKNASVEEAHQLCDHLEQDIEKKLKFSNVTIHIEPCSGECEECPACCEEKAKNLPNCNLSQHSRHKLLASSYI